ncbi:hypothetical protein [Actomonas aquatica]|uniref:Uncharacterized protein n=1 Tax=Actomonas aquatica TaxID=2866162 RepID=A0ABZ1C6J1_9BACT|nr:hypothetical protein [Opitutus sp. WL0086]WRQ87343.1 hypothetical protein K1X11_021220 [Opitutus sp. WL0086]
MGFKAYRAHPTTPNGWTLTHGTPVRLSGPHGLVALWFRQHPVEANVPWRIAPEAWLPADLPPADLGEETWLVFEQSEDGIPCYSRLIAINGIAERKVEVMLTFAPLLTDSVAPDLRVQSPAVSRQWTEELALDAGPLNARCTWRLTRPHLTLGAAVLKPAVTAAPA